ncbi:hypothetical protein POM88_014438 [Heracleum sosnowskyi]|uniref:Transposase n=1 Tax=Heracleum sosnowskyi TaxID=360622 RepID=A0AAD8J3N8_9APIA|nr:hypothetical protein POM88_014438 [Heracleum sosnowskyi]
MQPHVVIRARPSPLISKGKKAEKRTFVTLQNINAEKTKKLKDMNINAEKTKKLKDMNINAEKTKKLKDMNDEKEMINNTRKKLQFSNVDDGTPGEELIGLSDYLKRFESPRPETKTSGGETKTAAGEKSGKNAEGQGCNDYEIKRNDNIAKNKAKLKELGLVRDEAAKSCQKDKGKYKVTNDNASESEYFPNNDDAEAERQSDHSDDNVTSKRTKKVKRQRVEIGAGPRTCSRATKLPDSSQMKEPDAGASLQVNKAPVVSLKEKLNNLRNGPGSMTAYLALREQEKVDSQKEIPRVESEMQHLQSQSVEKPVDEAPKRKRGKTKMNHVHNRAEKKRITLNYLNQPVADDGKLLSEFTNFLGTTVRQFVSLTCASWHQVPEKQLLWEYVKDKYIVPDDAKPWVNKSMSDHFRSYKSRIKRDYYNTYPTDEERLSHRPEEVSLSDWKILLNYWGDEKVQEIAKKNSEARQKITETHTTGSTSFAQVAHMLRLEKLAKLEKEKQEKLGKMLVNDDGEGEGNGEEDPIKVSDADIYLATRKRDEKREYKLPEQVLKMVNDKIVDVKKTLETEDTTEDSEKSANSEKSVEVSYEDDNDVNTD